MNARGFFFFFFRLRTPVINEKSALKKEPAINHRTRINILLVSPERDATFSGQMRSASIFYVGCLF